MKKFVFILELAGGDIDKKVADVDDEEDPEVNIEHEQEWIKVKNRSTIIEFTRLSHIFFISELLIHLFLQQKLKSCHILALTFFFISVSISYSIKRSKDWIWQESVFLHVLFINFQEKLIHLTVISTSIELTQSSSIY